MSKPHVGKGVINGTVGNVWPEVVLSPAGLRPDYKHMRPHRSVAFPEAVASQMATAQTAFPHTTSSLNLPHPRFQTNARYMLVALFTVNIVNLRLQILRSHGRLLPSLGGSPALALFLFSPLPFTKNRPRRLGWPWLHTS